MPSEIPESPQTLAAADGRTRPIDLSHLLGTPPQGSQKQDGNHGRHPADQSGDAEPHSDLSGTTPTSAVESPSDRRELLTRIPPLRSGDRVKLRNALLPAVAAAHTEIQHAVALVNKGATYTARLQLEAALHRIAEALDHYHHTAAHQESLTAGLLALRESADLLSGGGDSRANGPAAPITARHRSGVLSLEEQQSLTCAAAHRRYLEFAEEHIAASAGGVPVASEALFALGKLCVHQPGSTLAAKRQSQVLAMSCFRTALRVDDGHFAAANELGVLLAREGQLREARDLLQLSVAVHPLPTTWRNLAIVHERLGDAQLAQYSLSQQRRLADAGAGSSPPVITTPQGTTVYWVDRSTFERGGVGAWR